MMDFIPCSVTELTATIRDLFENDDRMRDVLVSGEVSNMTQASSGHWYFTLKDANAALKCVMWRSAVAQQSFTPRTGDAIIAHGKVGVYEPRGEYQLYADLVRPAGVGDLYQWFEELKTRLDAEGLFDPLRKRPIPAFPRQIGVVTSPDAAAFQDIQNVLRRRFPLAEIILSPTMVQGIESPPMIVAAIERLNQHTDVDVILVCRGGGSIEDLWAFNDERVARAIANSRIPVVCGVGHETDFTIADFVADLRAPTPSAAAELAVPNIDDLSEAVRRLSSDMIAIMGDVLNQRRADLERIGRTLTYSSPESQIRTVRQRIDDLNARMINRQHVQIALLREKLDGRVKALTAANPQAILARGYAIVYRSKDGQRVKSSAGVEPGTAITIALHDGELNARVEDKDTP
jgi:exodeoxyribonuclease VII large subunit